MNSIDEFSQQLAKAERLHAVTQQVGFGLWQLQELEGAAAQYYVLVALARRRMGVEAGKALVDDAQSRTFGATITKLVKGKHLPGDVEPRFQSLLKERKWLVHSSRSTSRDAIHNDAACSMLGKRLDAIAEEARLLLRIVGKAAEEHVKRHGISSEKIDEITAQTLKTWHSGNAANPLLKRTVNDMALRDFAVYSCLMAPCRRTLSSNVYDCSRPVRKSASS